MRKFTAILTLTVFLASFIPAAALQNVTAYALCTENAYTELKSPDTAMASKDKMQLVTSSDSNTKYATTRRDIYLEFDLSSYDEAFTSAAIRLHCEDVSSKVDRTLSVYALTEPWDEATLTYNSAPAVGALITVYNQPKESSNDFWMEIDISSYAQAMEGKDTVSFVITSSVAATKFSTRHTANAPTLKVGFASEAEVADVTVNTVDETGSAIAEPKTLSAIKKGSFTYGLKIPESVNYRATDFVYDAQRSITQIDVGSGENAITLCYNDPCIAGKNLKKAIVCASEDAYIKANEIDEAFGTTDAGRFCISNTAGVAGAAAIRDGLLKFDISKVDYTHIAACTLVGYLLEGTNTGERKIFVNALSNDWDGASVTWKTAPEAGERLDEFLISDSTQLKWFSADITDYVRGAGDTLSLRLSCDTGANNFSPLESGTDYAFALDIRYSDEENIKTGSVTVNYLDSAHKAIIAPDILEGVLCGEYTYGGKYPDIIVNGTGEYILESINKTITVGEGENNIDIIYHTALFSEISGEVLDEIDNLDIRYARDIRRDAILPKTPLYGGVLQWVSSDKTVMSDSGAICPKESDTPLTLTAKLDLPSCILWRAIDVTVRAKGAPSESMLLSYEFESDQVYEKDGLTYVKDMSGVSGDGVFMGTSGTVSGGVMDLSKNTMTARRVSETNSYLLAPDNLTKNLRSYTFLADVKLADFAEGYRVFSFGAGGNNAVFGRLAPLSEGAKWNAKTTQFLHSDETIAPNKFCRVAYTYDAFCGVSAIYVNGTLAASGKSITFEGCDLIGENNRNYIGRSQWWDTYYEHSAEDNPDFTGKMDNFKMYSRALDASEIAALTSDVFGGVEKGEKSVSAQLLRESFTVGAVYDNGTLLEVKAQVVAENESFDAVFSQSGEIKLFAFAADTSLIPLCTVR